MCTWCRGTARTVCAASSGPGPATPTTPRWRPPPRPSGSRCPERQRGLAAEQRCNTVITMAKDTNRTDPTAVPPAAAKLQGWFAGRLPDGWFPGPREVSHARDEIVVTGTLPDPSVAPDGGDAAPEMGAAARRARIQGFCEDTRAL